MIDKSDLHRKSADRFCDLYWSLLTIVAETQNIDRDTIDVGVGESSSDYRERLRSLLSPNNQPSHC